MTKMKPDLAILERVETDMKALEPPPGEDVIRAHALLLSRLARHGTWFSGAERIAIAAEVRGAGTCDFCRERKKSLSPYTVEGEHTRAHGSDGLAVLLVDRVHLAVTDAPRTTKAAIDSLGEVGITAGHYVEALGIVATILSIDQACRGLGVPQHALPTPLGGEPAREEPPGLGDIGGFVSAITWGPPPPPNEDLWGEAAPNVSRALSGAPNAVRDLILLSEVQYVPLEVFEDPTEQRTLSRPQMEIVASRVSAINDCFY